jgi:hypothetical protein
LREAALAPKLVEPGLPGGGEVGSGGDEGCFFVRHGGILPGNGYRAIARRGLAKGRKACIATGTKMEQAMAKPDNPVLMGVIGAPHGVRGELRVKPYTGDPLALGDYGTLYDKRRAAPST